MGSNLSDAAWEAMHAHYDQPTYQAVCALLSPSDVVLDIGAGDLQLARQMARMTRKVYAIEINALVLEQAHVVRELLPVNLISFLADARAMDFPSDITTGVLMMRHCTCFRLFAEKLQKAGASRLITNARWHMAVEVVDLRVQRKSFVEAGTGWYACFCGRIGFKEGPLEHWSVELDRMTNEVSNCPQCAQEPREVGKAMVMEKL